MPTIESSGYPLVFSVAGGSATAVGGRPTPDFRDVAPEAEGLQDDPGGQVADEQKGVGSPTVAVRTEVRAFEGMQKEALVTLDGGRPWRLVSDEGPYLNGTDLAPFPLAFYAAGMQFSFLSQLLQGARAQGIEIDSAELAQDTFYSMEGSFLRGDALGGAMPARLELSVEAHADAPTIAGLVRMAESSSAGQAFMRSPMTNVFALSHNGRSCTVAGVAPSMAPMAPAPDFQGVVPDPDHPVATDIITKVEGAEAVHGVEGGAGSSLLAEQKRTLHIHGEARVGEGMAMEALIRLHKPIGSTFRFRCDEVESNGGGETAPPPLAYLAAGVAFCYMTQLGRYAHILKKPLASYSLVQDTFFDFDGASEEGTLTVSARPVDTHVHMASEGSDELAQDFVTTGARTCFLHAAMSGAHPSEVSVRLNGSAIPI